MSTRRKFIQLSSGIIAATAIKPNTLLSENSAISSTVNMPTVISTWKHGLAANDAAWSILEQGGSALDAVEQGVRVSEGDPEVTSVGYGGMPDRDGNVTLDACIMDEKGNCGSVAFVQNIMHPISLARLVMEKTEHIMLVGKGAEKFASQNGIKKENLLTENARKQWQEWLKISNYDPNHPDNHDTIGMLAIDKNGNLSGACTTSGLAWKLHGRVGDSPIIGAGLYVDNDAGAAAATGKGESVIKITGSFLIVELMRHGYTPKAACEEAVMRIVKKQKDFRDFQVGFIAMNKLGETGSFSLQSGFEAALCDYDKKGVKNNRLIASDYYLK